MAKTAERRQSVSLQGDMSGAWKNAAGEICDLLAKVRDQGADCKLEATLVKNYM